MGAAESLDERASLRVIASDDLLQGFVVASSPFEGDAPALEEILRSAGFGGPLDDEGVAMFLRDRPIGTPVRVVRGRPAIEGVDAVLEYVFASLAPPAPPTQSDGGEREPFAIDHRESHALERCAAGDVLVRRSAGRAAVDGVDVYGRAIPAPRGREPKLSAGSNASITEDGASIVASIDGVPIREASGRVVVNPAVTVKQVDFKSGNIHFDGSVIVGGGIRRHSVVYAAGNVDARFVDSESHVEARGLVRIGQNAIQATLIGDEGIGVNGQLVASNVRSWSRVDIGILGCPHGSLTTVSVERPNLATLVHALREELGLVPHDAHPESRHGTPSGVRPAPPSSPGARLPAPGHHAPAQARAGTLAAPPRAPTPRAPTPRAPSSPAAARALPAKLPALKPPPSPPNDTKGIVRTKVTAAVERKHRENALAHAEREMAVPASANGRVNARTAVRPGVTITIAHDVLTIDEDQGPRAFFVGENGITQAAVAPPSGPASRVTG